MRIISKFTDYYDSILVSSEPVFIRLPETIKHPQFSKEVFDKFERFFRYAPSVYMKNKEKKYFDSFSFKLLFFCGKVYPVFSNEEVDVHSIDFDDFETRMGELGYKVQRSSNLFFQLKYKKIPFEEGVSKCISDNGIDVLAEMINLHFKTPIVMVSRKLVFEINPSLKRIVFQKKFDPWTCAQEIEMYLGTFLVDNLDKSCIMSDDLKRHSKGMDEWSFKQVGPKKRKRKIKENLV